MASSIAPTFYKSVIEDVVLNVREIFLDENIDEHILQELKQAWDNKVMGSKALKPLSTIKTPAMNPASRHNIQSLQRNRAGQPLHIMSNNQITTGNRNIAPVGQQPISLQGMLPSNVLPFQGQTGQILAQGPNGSPIYLQAIPGNGRIMSNGQPVSVQNPTFIAQNGQTIQIQQAQMGATTIPTTTPSTSTAAAAVGAHGAGPGGVTVAGAVQVPVSMGTPTTTLGPAVVQNMQHNIVTQQPLDMKIVKQSNQIVQIDGTMDEYQSCQYDCHTSLPVCDEILSDDTNSTRKHSSTPTTIDESREAVDTPTAPIQHSLTHELTSPSREQASPVPACSSSSILSSSDSTIPTHSLEQTSALPQCPTIPTPSALSLPHCSCYSCTTTTTDDTPTISSTSSSEDTTHSPDIISTTASPTTTTTSAYSASHYQRPMPVCPRVVAANDALLRHMINNASTTPRHLQQLDGRADNTSEESSLDSEDNDDVSDDSEIDEEPLCSDDDISDEDQTAEIFDTDNVVVCQFEKIQRNKNKWKFCLKDGIMNLNGHDFIFQKLNGDAEW